MQNLQFDNTCKQKCVLCLGFFESVHIGHQQLIKSAMAKANFCNSKTFVFTFSTNPYKIFGHGEGELFTFFERFDYLKKLGVDGVISSPMTKEFCDISAEDFLDVLSKNFNIAEAFCGSDYTFGRGGLGDVKLLKKIFNAKGIGVSVVDFALENGKKISSCQIRKQLLEGDVVACNKALGRPYSITATVVSGFSRGRVIGFPTANIKIDLGKLYPMPAVYATAVEADGKIYPSITNVGIKPTFDDNTLSIESFIDGFSGDLYGKTITLSFFEKIRDIKKFNTKEELAEELKRNLSYSKTVKREL